MSDTRMYVGYNSTASVRETWSILWPMEKWHTEVWDAEGRDSVFVGKGLEFASGIVTGGSRCRCVVRIPLLPGAVAVVSINTQGR